MRTTACRRNDATTTCPKVIPSLKIPANGKPSIIERYELANGHDGKDSFVMVIDNIGVPNQVGVTLKVGAPRN